MQLLARQARAMDGTSPSIVTRALSMKWPKGRPSGEPCSEVRPCQRHWQNALSKSCRLSSMVMKQST